MIEITELERWVKFQTAVTDVSVMPHRRLGKIGAAVIYPIEDKAINVFAVIGVERALVEARQNERLWPCHFDRYPAKPGRP